MAFGNSFFAQTTGAPKDRDKRVQEPAAQPDKISVNELEVAEWGKNNKFPDDADAVISRIGVLNTGLRYIRNFTLGQGIYPVKVTGYDEKGNELVKIVDDADLRYFVNSRMVRRYLEKALRDYLKFGIAQVQLLPNLTGNEMIGINTINAKYCRLSVAGSDGRIGNCVVSGKWPEIPSDKGDYHIMDVLDEYDPAFHLQGLRNDKSMKDKSFIFTIRDSWSNNEYYSSPIWYSAYLAGWTDIAFAVPRFLQKAFENQISWKWHVQIPYVFFDKKFPVTSFKTEKEREDAINAFMDQIETNLCNPDNANKAIFTMFEINPNNGKVEEQWIIKPLDNKLNSEQNLITSAACNSEILFSLMVNPNVMGAGMPGGSYAGNQGGSNIREAFLVNIANAWIDRQNLLDPLEAFLRFNGKYTDVELRFRNTILTTLDTGAGTAKTIS